MYNIITTIPLKKTIFQTTEMIHCITKSCFNCQFSIAAMYYFHTPPKGYSCYFKNTREKRKLSEFNGAVENGVSSIVPISMI